MLQSMESHRVEHNSVTEQQQQIFNFPVKKIKSKLYISLPNVLYALLMSGNHCLSWEIANGNEITAGCSDIMCTFKPRENKDSDSIMFCPVRNMVVEGNTYQL